MMIKEVEKRLWRRHDLDPEQNRDHCLVETEAGSRYTIKVLNISIGGLSFSVVPEDGANGDWKKDFRRHARIRFHECALSLWNEQVSGNSAIITWTEGETLGCKFIQPLGLQYS
jgi:hypothetical protein